MWDFVSHNALNAMIYWGERERAPPLMMSTTLTSVRPSVRPRTSRRLRMRDIHVIYADSNSADFAGFKHRLQLKWSQCKHSKKGTVRRDWNDVDNRNGRDVLEKRQRRETEGAVFETRGTGKEDGLDVLRDVLLRLRSLSAYVHVLYVYVYIYANSLTLAPQCPAFH